MREEVGQPLAVLAPVLGHPDGPVVLGQGARQRGRAARLRADDADAHGVVGAHAGLEVVPVGQRARPDRRPGDRHRPALAVDQHMSRAEVARVGVAVVLGGEDDVGGAAEDLDRVGGPGGGVIVPQDVVDDDDPGRGVDLAKPGGAQIGARLLARLAHDQHGQLVHLRGRGVDQVLVAAVRRVELPHHQPADRMLRHGPQPRLSAGRPLRPAPAACAARPADRRRTCRGRRSRAGSSGRARARRTGRCRSRRR